MIDYDTFTLSNGMRCVHSYDAMTAMVAVDIIYNVGSRDEDPSLTGLAHLLEHLMFGGSLNAPDYDAAIERAGGSDNAWTSDDFTNYYSLAPAANLDTLLWLESDRMASLAITPSTLEVQRAVVIEEFKQTHLNVPYGDFTSLLRGLLYTTHPYRHITIGADIDHIRRITLDDVRRFHASHYCPANAVLAIVGNVSLDEARRKAEYWFGSIPAGSVPPRLYAPEPPVTSPRTLTVHRQCPSPRIAIAFPMGPFGSDDYYEGDLLTDILAGGRASVLRSELLNRHSIFSSADALISGHHEAGYLMLHALLAQGTTETDVPRAISLLTSTARSLGATGADDCSGHSDRRAPHRPISQSDIDRAITGKESRLEFSLSQLTIRAEMLAEAVMKEAPLHTLMDRYRLITPGCLTSAVTRLMDPSRSATLIYLPHA